MNGNGEWGNGQGLANQLNNDANTNLTIRAIVVSIRNSASA